MSVATTALPGAPATDADGRPLLRLLPAPACEPPFDDELAAAPSATPSARPPASTPLLVTGIALRLVPHGATGAVPDDDDEAPSRTPLSQLPPARPFALALVQRLLEVLAGLRPLSQLRRDTSFELLCELEQALTARPLSSGSRPTRRDVCSLHVQARDDGVAEVCATVRRGGRVCALALRLEGVDGGWRCTELRGV